jgi:hypothetical protein
MELSSTFVILTTPTVFKRSFQHGLGGLVLVSDAKLFEYRTVPTNSMHLAHFKSNQHVQTNVDNASFMCPNNLSYLTGCCLDTASDHTGLNHIFCRLGRLSRDI